MSALGDGGEEGGKGKEVAQPKGWRLEIMKALQEMFIISCNQSFITNNDLESLVCQALSWVLMMQQ